MFKNMVIVPKTRSPNWTIAACPRLRPLPLIDQFTVSVPSVSWMVSCPHCIGEVGSEQVQFLPSGRCDLEIDIVGVSLMIVILTLPVFVTPFQVAVAFTHATPLALR